MTVKGLTEKQRMEYIQGLFLGKSVLKFDDIISWLLIFAQTDQFPCLLERD